MTEFVVYEDSPLDEYLQSVDKVETTVKVTPPSLVIGTNSNTSIIHKRPSISRMWRHSMFHDAFSISLPRGEETAFEEKFKYLIVTSPLLNETLSVHHKRHSHQPDFQAATPTMSKLAITTNLAATLAILLGTEKCLIQPKLPIITLFFTASASLFFFYRHKRRSSIRQLYQIALTKIGGFTDQSDTFDTKVHRCLITIQEIELVSRGYRLSTPLSPISRIEQKSKHRKCIQLRNRLASVLRRAFMLYEEAIIDLMDVIHKKNLNTLYEMYNVHSIASLSAMGDGAGGGGDDEGYSLDQLKKLAQIMHLKRRECMVHFLALGAMTEDHDSVHYNYRDDWRAINEVLTKLVTETDKFTTEIVEALDAEFYKPLNSFDKNNYTTKISDTRLKKFVHRLSSLEQQLRTMEAKIYLCSEDVRQLNSSESTMETRERLLNEYMSVQKGFENMASEWEIGRAVLESFLNPPSSLLTKEEEEEEEQGSPLTEEEELEGKGIVLDSEDVADILNLPLASKASVFEAIAGVVEKNGREKSKMTRRERIEEMRLKRTKETEEKSTRLDSQTMVHELKSVLHKRINDLDLEDSSEDTQTNV
ncbi:Mysoin-binding motif of peroxisomes-domain-containing protein [Mucor mucedo]|uniref:Mysoin-binding motif of peroxisomes-domain-containing protein n=1 Tax=Mucor mucedo TaxID=29922 RepID=UPI00221F46C3|nr:Mysoin-binding motif of peroxisomes-domain-containing protein [Mucor mucedo]KAI7896529.1 Mysoin-binding motif of peroxisomes-domain-containing protein [Mucor mucedo]